MQMYHLDRPDAGSLGRPRSGRHLPRAHARHVEPPARQRHRASARTCPRGMGEGWSDFYARSLLSTGGRGRQRHLHRLADGPRNQISGRRTLDNYYYGIRRFPYAPRTHVGPNGRPHNPLTFADIDSDADQPDRRRVSARPDRRNTVRPGAQHRRGLGRHAVGGAGALHHAPGLCRRQPAHAPVRHRRHEARSRRPDDACRLATRSSRRPTPAAAPRPTSPTSGPASPRVAWAHWRRSLTQEPGPSIHTGGGELSDPGPRSVLLDQRRHHHRRQRRHHESSASR